MYKNIENHYCEEKLYVKIEFRISVVIIYIYFHTYVELERETPEGKKWNDGYKSIQKVIHIDLQKSSP